jgi:outer membrane lipopolysaccharide assembly protein LptE/RlpB
MATTYIDARDRYTIFYRELSSALRIGGVQLVDSSVDAAAVIRIESDVSGQSVLTVSGRNVPTEYDVYYSVRYSVWMEGQQILSPHAISLNQDYTYDETMVLGKNREADTIREAVAREVVRQVSQELSRLP